MSPEDRAKTQPVDYLHLGLANFARCNASTHILCTLYSTVYPYLCLYIYLQLIHTNTCMCTCSSRTLNGLNLVLKGYCSHAFEEPHHRRCRHGPWWHHRHHEVGEDVHRERCRGHPHRGPFKGFLDGSWPAIIFEASCRTRSQAPRSAATWVVRSSCPPRWGNRIHTLALAGAHPTPYRHPPAGEGTGSLVKSGL